MLIAILLTLAAPAVAAQPPIDNKTRDLLQKAAQSIGSGQNAFIKILGAHVEERSIIVNVEPLSREIEPSVLAKFPYEKWSDICGQPNLLAGMDRYAFTIEMRLILTSGATLSTVLTPSKCRELATGGNGTGSSPAPDSQASQSIESPLMRNAQLLLGAPVAVQYEFIKQSIPNFGYTSDRFAYLPALERQRITSGAYYLAAIDKASLLYMHDKDLADILNLIGTDGNSPDSIALNFEQTYRQKTGSWPPMLPVDVDALIRRMLNQRTIR